MRGDDEEQKVIPTDAPKAEEALADEQEGSASADQGSKEAAQLGSGAPIEDLERDAKENEHRRDQRFKDHFETLSIIMLDILFVGFILLSGIWILHLILPEHSMGTGWVSYIHGWLSEGQLDKITGVLAGGIIAGLVADHFKRRMGS